MDNLLADGETEPAVIVTTNSQYMGASPYTTNLEGTIIPFVQSHYNVSTNRMDRAFAGLSLGASMTINIINNNPLRFGYYGVFSWTPPPRTTTANIKQAYIYMGCGAWDNLNLCVRQDQLSARRPGQLQVRQDRGWSRLQRLAPTLRELREGTYDVTFTSSDGTRTYSLSTSQTVTITVRDVTAAEQLSGLKSAVTVLDVNGGIKIALTVKIDQASKLVAKGKTAEAVSLLADDFVGQVTSLLTGGKLTEAQASALTAAAQEAIQNITS